MEASFTSKKINETTTFYVAPVLIGCSGLQSNE